MKREMRERTQQTGQTARASKTQGRHRIAPKSPAQAGDRDVCYETKMRREGEGESRGERESRER